MVSFLRRAKGFTLLELLIVMALIAILVGIVIAALNPGRQFALARNSTRYAHLNTIMNGISANAAENNGIFTCASEALGIPAVATTMRADDADPLTEEYDIAPCLVTEYLSQMPFDPSVENGEWTSEADYLTGYSISQDASDRITVTAPEAELSETISITR